MRNNVLKLFLVLIMALPVILQAAEIPWPRLPGRWSPNTYRIEWPGLKHPYVSVNIPKNYQPGKTYNLLYWFHGTNGQPNPGIGVLNDAYITIGMTYSLEKSFLHYGAYAEHHWEKCQKLGEFVADILQVKFDRCYLGGFSKGGWMAFYHGASAFPGLDGVIIGGAGYPARWTQDLKKLKRPFDVLILIGENDPNYPCSQQAISYFQSMNARVTYAEFLTHGHTWLPTPKVKNWLKVQTLLDQPDLLTAFCDQSLQQDIVLLNKQADPWKRYLGFRGLLTDPRTRYLSPALRTDFLAQGKALKELPELQTRINHLKHLHALVKKEANFYFGKLPAVKSFLEFAAQYKKLHETLESGDVHDRAVFGEIRARQLQEIAEQQTKAMGGDKERLAREKELHDLKSLESFAPNRLTAKQRARLAQLDEQFTQRKDKAISATMTAMGDTPMSEELKRKVRDVMIRQRATPNEPRPFSGLGF